MINYLNSLTVRGTIFSIICAFILTWRKLKLDGSLEIYTENICKIKERFHKLKKNGRD